MKKWVWGAISGVLVIPALVFGREHFGKVWAAPASIETVDQKVNDLSDVVKRQGELHKETTVIIRDIQHRQEMSEKVSQVQYEAMKELVKEIKRK